MWIRHFVTPAHPILLYELTEDIINLLGDEGTLLILVDEPGLCGDPSQT